MNDFVTRHTETESTWIVFKRTINTQTTRRLSWTSCSFVWAEHELFLKTSSIKMYKPVLVCVVQEPLSSDLSRVTPLSSWLIFRRNSNKGDNRKTKGSRRTSKVRLTRTSILQVIKYREYLLMILSYWLLICNISYSLNSIMQIYNTKRGHADKEQHPDILLKQQICSEVLFSSMFRETLCKKLTCSAGANELRAADRKWDGQTCSCCWFEFE